MELLREAGVFAWLGLAILSGGLMYAVVRPDPGARVAKALAVVVLAVGMLGASLGQRLVDRAVDAEPDVTKKVVMLSVGTRETSANLLLSSLYALALMAVAASVQRVRRSHGA